ncbi:zinc-ribbon domain-containing protein [Agromyces sp. G08B096]|uniref:Zinc-ribbon domain-containing protein n=1 Tax=Agromyces sp. G08B096 TaxID=3156399 RepID=A0AAU7WCM1_9MICO
MPGVNDLATSRPDVAKLWHPSANSSAPEGVTAGSSKVAWWVCPKDARHRWQRPITSQVQSGAYCPVCEGRIAIAGVNDLATARPDLAAQWDPSNALAPEEVTTVTSKIVGWVCPAHTEHRWRARVGDRAKGYGCPICSGRRAFAGFNDLASRNPGLAAEWDPANPIRADQVTFSSARKVNWICPNDARHKWLASVNSRNSGGGRGCPFCAGKRIHVGSMDLATTHPDVAAAWDRERNTRTPQQVTAGSGYRAHWVCVVDPEHRWQTSVSNRALGGNECPECSRRVASRIERVLFEALADHLDAPAHGRKVPVPWGPQTAAELDISGSYRGAPVAIEYDGLAWHENRADVDIAKTTAILEAGYFVVRIRQGELPHLELEHPRLLQLDYRYRSGTDDRLALFLQPTVATILKWLEAQTTRSPEPSPTGDVASPADLPPMGEA